MVPNTCVDWPRLCPMLNNTLSDECTRGEGWMKPLPFRNGRFWEVAIFENLRRCGDMKMYSSADDLSKRLLLWMRWWS